ncbi:MAG TPA: hypothetical protein VD903_12345 [Pseudonocardia sp.]|nr:hypothetical protein [Pseudonocardia sp.]
MAQMASSSRITDSHPGARSRESEVRPAAAEQVRAAGAAGLGDRR